MLLPLSSPVYDGEFDHGGGGGGCGGQSAVAVAAVEAVEDNLSAKAAGNESVDGRMTAMTKSDGGQQHNTPPTHGGAVAAVVAAVVAVARQREVGGSLATVQLWRQRKRGRRRQRKSGRRRQRESGCRRQLGGGEALAAVRQRNIGGSLAAVLRRRCTARQWQRGGSSAVAAAVAAATSSALYSLCSMPSHLDRWKAWSQLVFRVNQYNGASDSNKKNFAIWSKMVRLDPTIMVSMPKWHRP